MSVSRRGTEVYRDTDAAAALIRIFEKQAGRSAVHVHVQGIITNDAGQPVARAVVRVEAPVRAAITNDSGYFELRSLPAKPKTIVLRVTRPGYEPVRFGLPVVAGAPRQVRIVLNPLASEKR